MPLIGKSLLRYLPFLIEWGIKHCSYLKYRWQKTDLHYYSSVLQNPKKALASSLLYRTFLAKELIPIYLGKYKQQKLTVPTHLLIGEDDPIINPAVFKHADQNGAFKMTIVPKCGHFIPEEKPEVVAALINTF
jgi:pimeloyl-ACP methyl ester carboxylesterase